MQAMGFIISKLQTPLEKNELPELGRPLTVRMEGVTAAELLFLFAYWFKGASAPLLQHWPSLCL